MEDEYINKLFQENRLRRIIHNWKYLIVILKILFPLLFFIFVFIGDKKLAYIRGTLITICIIIILILDFWIFKNQIIAKNAGIFLKIVLALVATEVNVNFPYFR